MENDIKQRTVDLQSALRAAGVVNETQLPEPVHEEAYARTGGAYHFSQCLLTDLGDYGFGNAILAKVGEQ